MDKNNLHVTPNSNKGWNVTPEGHRPICTSSTQAQAEQIAKQILRRSGGELIIHGRNGRIREKNTYGSDPYPPRG